MAEIGTICIFSTTTDYSTTQVIRWLRHFGAGDVIRINSDDTSHIGLNITSETIEFTISDRTLSVNDIKAIWYRKGRNWLANQFTSPRQSDCSAWADYRRTRLKFEEIRLAEYIHSVMQSRVPTLGNAMNGDLNKLLVLRAAQQVGFTTPMTFISNNREGVMRLINAYPNLITKAISDPIYCFDRRDTLKGYFSYTEEMGRDTVNSLPDTFAPSLLQTQIKKDFEVRVFFLIDECYSMAIMSQHDPQTRVDYRRYIESKPNRMVPYTLPISVDIKIKNLFKLLNLNTGSVDLIVDTEGNFVFLEINPVGMFSMISRPCNYNLEKRIAQRLIEYATRSEN